MVLAFCVDGFMSSCGCAYDILKYQLVIKGNRFNEESEQSMTETTENTVNLPIGIRNFLLRNASPICLVE